MKMTALRLVGAESVDLPLRDADAAGPFVLKGAEGLGPPEINVRMARSIFEKATYQGKSTNLRQFIIHIGLQPDWNSGQTSADLRAILYPLLTPKYNQMVRVEVMDGNVVQAFAQGHISTFEASLFTKDPAVQITLDCDYGYLLAPSVLKQRPVQSVVSGIRAFDVLNSGTAPAGFRAGFEFTANVSGQTLTLRDEDVRGQKMQIKGLNWLAGDKFLIDTRPGSRGVWKSDGGAPYVSILSNIDSAVSEWIHLHDGDNRFLINTAGFDWDSTYEFSHQPAFWGV